MEIKWLQGFAKAFGKASQFSERQNSEDNKLRNLKRSRPAVVRINCDRILKLDKVHEAKQLGGEKEKTL